MPAAKDLCQKCGQRPGSAWDGSGGFTWICGLCKIQQSFDAMGLPVSETTPDPPEDERLN